jgi:hypothetical protein
MEVKFCGQAACEKSEHQIANKTTAKRGRGMFMQGFLLDLTTDKLRR